MDLQKFLRHPIKSEDVGYIIRNLTMLLQNLTFEPSSLLKKSDVEDFNEFILQFIESSPQELGVTTLLDVPSIPTKYDDIRVGNTSYYSTVGISEATIEEHLSFPTVGKTDGTYLYPQEQTPEFMIDKRFLMNEATGWVYLRVPEAGNRIVRMSIQGFQELRKIQGKSAVDLVDIQERIAALFTGQSIVVTGRTKSDLSILDKVGRISEKTQETSVSKYLTTKDIIDINGCRITCRDSSQIEAVIATLEREGFEFLELDNKYNTIRKDGAYKVIPLTLCDPKTGNIFELQITTMASTTVTDLFHNVIYKKEAIGLELTGEQREFVLRAQRAGALVETQALFTKQAGLAGPMDEVQQTQMLLALKARSITVRRTKM